MSPTAITEANEEAVALARLFIDTARERGFVVSRVERFFAEGYGTTDATHLIVTCPDEIAATFYDPAANLLGFGPAQRRLQVELIFGLPVGGLQEDGWAELDIWLRSATKPSALEISYLADRSQGLQTYDSLTSRFT